MVVGDICLVVIFIKLEVLDLVLIGSCSYNGSIFYFELSVCVRKGDFVINCFIGFWLLLKLDFYVYL